MPLLIPIIAVAGLCAVAAAAAVEHRNQQRDFRRQQSAQQEADERSEARAAEDRRVASDAERIGKIDHRIDRDGVFDTLRFEIDQRWGRRLGQLRRSRDEARAEVGRADEELEAGFDELPFVSRRGRSAKFLVFAASAIVVIAIANQLVLDFELFRSAGLNLVLSVVFAIAVTAVLEALSLVFASLLGLHTVKPLRDPEAEQSTEPDTAQPESTGDPEGNDADVIDLSDWQSASTNNLHARVGLPKTRRFAGLTVVLSVAAALILGVSTLSSVRADELVGEDLRIARAQLELDTARQDSEAIAIQTQIVDGLEQRFADTKSTVQLVSAAVPAVVFVLGWTPIVGAEVFLLTRREREKRALERAARADENELEALNEEISREMGQLWADLGRNPSEIAHAASEPGPPRSEAVPPDLPDTDPTTPDAQPEADAKPAATHDTTTADQPGQDATEDPAFDDGWSLI